MVLLRIYINFIGDYNCFWWIIFTCECTNILIMRVIALGIIVILMIWKIRKLKISDNYLAHL